MRSRNADPVPLPRQRRVEPCTRVGSKFRGGELSTGAKNGKVWVNAYIGTGITADVTPDEAEAFAYAVLEQARRAREG